MTTLIIAGTHIINHFKLFSDFRVNPWSLLIIPIDLKRKTFVRRSKTMSLHIAHCWGDNMKNSQDIIKQRMVEERIIEAHSRVENHPDPVVEISSLASVSSPSFWYKLVLLEEKLNIGALSVLQLESLVHACQRHQQRLPNGSRAGFLVGDGAGVGKGRIAAGIIYENFLRGRKKSIWLSVSNELKYDVVRDLRDIGAVKIAFHHLPTIRSSSICRDIFGSIEEGLIFSTFSSLTAFSPIHRKFEPCLEELLEWCGDDYDGVIIFDEFNQSKMQFHDGSKKTPAVLCSTVVQLQRRLPNARIVYVCATGISEPQNMSYMTRLGLWGTGTPFDEFEDFTKAFEDVGCMELVGMEMKQRGMYLARQLSFQDVLYNMYEVCLDRKFIKVYDNSVELWVDIQWSFSKAEQLQTMDPEAHKTLWFNFWAAHYDFFKHLCISAKVLDAAAIAKRAVKKGKSVVIGLQTTGETATLIKIQKEGCDLSDVVSTAKGVLVDLVRKHFPIPRRRPTGKRSPYIEIVGEKRKQASDGSDRKCKKKKSDSSYNEVRDFEAVIKYTKKMQNRLLEKIDRLGYALPGNWIDQLIDELGGPHKVAEISSRKGRVVAKSDAKIRYELRSENGVPLEKINMREREYFMKGKKNIVIITEVAGISLQEDQRVNNQRPRIFISLECPSSPDLILQQFGCLHRTGCSKQISRPELIFLYSELAREKQLIANVVKKLESLGGTGCGDLCTFETVDPNAFVYSEHGQNALQYVMKSILGYTEPLVPPPRNYEGHFFKDVAKALANINFVWNFHDNSPHSCLPSYKNSVTKFLRRSLGIPVELQTRLFQYFIDTLSVIIRRAFITSDLNGTGIADIGIDQDVQCNKLYRFSTQLPDGPAKVEFRRFEIDRGVTWTVASTTFSHLTGPYDGFYRPTSKKSKSQIVSLIGQKNIAVNRADQTEFFVIRPNSGLQFCSVSLDCVKKLKKISSDEAKPIWTDYYQSSKDDCMHVHMSGHCPLKDARSYCNHGLRRWSCTILSGPLLSVWNEVESVLKEKSSLKVGCVNFENDKIFGLIIPSVVESKIIKLLIKHYGKSRELS